MSSRYYSRRPRTRSSRISRESTKGDDADDWSSHSAAASGERAWDYLLRRKTEHINDRIHKRKGMEFEEEKAEDFSQSARKVKRERIESDEDLPLHMRYQEISCSRSYATSRGFWNDTEGEWLNKEVPVRVKSEPDDDHNTMTSRSYYFERETTTLRERRPESPPVRVKSEPVDKPNTLTARSRHSDRDTTTLRERRYEHQHTLDVDYATKICYDRDLPGDDIPRDLIANVSNYIEDARRATKHRHSSTSTIADDDQMYSAETHQPANESYGRNVRDHNLIHIPTDTKIVHPVQNYRRSSADRMSYGGSNESYQSYGQALYQDTSNNYTGDSYHDTNQSHRRPMANETSSHKRSNYDDNDIVTNLGTRQGHGRYIAEDMLFHNRQNINEAAYPTVTQDQRTHMPYELLHRNSPINEGDDGRYRLAIHTHGRLTPDETLYHDQLCDDEATFNATGQRNGHYETLYYNGTNSSYNCSYLTERQSEEKDMPSETLFRNPPNNSVEDLRHLLNIKSRGKSPVVPDMPFDPPLMQNTGTQDSVEDTCLLRMQSDKKDNQATAGNRTLIRSLPYPAEGVEVVYTADSVEADAWLRNNVVDCDVSAVGFDIEWKPQFVSKKKGGKENKTAVLQLAVEKSCLVLHLHHMDTMPNYLNSVLTDTKVVKVGSGILQDVTKLKRDTRLKCVGFEDTQTLARSVGVPRSSKFGLKALADQFLGVQLSKPKSVSKSNWEKFPLRIQQIHYAALDAWIGLKIYQCMKRMKDAGTTVAPSHGDTSITAPPVEAIPCHVCNKKVKDKVALEQHMKTVHANGETAQPTKAVPVGKIRCHVCNKKVKDNNDLTQHLNMVHAKCKYGKFFMAKIEKSHQRTCPALKADKKTCPKVSSSTSVEKEVPTLPVHVCQGCGKKCKTTEKLIEHIREVQHVSCPFCTKLLPIVSSSSHIQKCKKFLGGPWKELSTGQVSSTANG